MQRLHNLKIAVVAALLMAAFAAGSCKKLIEIRNPEDKLVSSYIFADSSTAAAAVNGMYSQFYNGGGTGYSIYSYRISLLPGESADEMTPVQNTFNNFYNNSLVPGNSDVSDLWANSYTIINIANNIIGGAQASQALTDSFKKQLVAEASFMRALCHFYLVNYFGKVPLILSSDVNKINMAPASDSAQVYTQIVADLVTARDALGDDYSWSAGDRTRVNRYAAAAMLARVYLYQGRWADAEAAATEVIGQTGLYGMEDDLDKVFLANSREAIWQCYTNGKGYTYFADNLVPYTPPLAQPSYALNPLLYNAFETGDLRKAKWIGSTTLLGTTYLFPYKYKSKTDNNAEFETVLRLPEQYLVRAEARARQGNVEGAIQDLYVVRHRAGLEGTTATDAPGLLKAVEHERQVELFCEWGHRWLDLRRTGRIDAVLGVEKTSWTSTAALYPIPQTAINTNPTLQQNPGYH